MRAASLLHRALELRDRLRGARQAARPRGEVVFLAVVRATTELTRRLATLPPRAPMSATERVALSLAAAQLRHLGASLVSDAPLDRSTPEGALAELVLETLALVDGLLAESPELAKGAGIEVRALEGPR